jgi:transcriptional regulator with XRE-family HTH domain
MIDIKDLDELMKEQGKTATAVSERAGLGKMTIYNWRKGINPTLSNYQYCLEVLGYKLQVVKVDE